MLPARGLCVISLACACLAGACAAPIGAPEAQSIASARLTRYCAGNCGTVHFTRAQKIKDRWLVDFDGATHKYTIIVEADGNTQFTVWNKNPAASP